MAEVCSGEEGLRLGELLYQPGRSFQVFLLGVDVVYGNAAGRRLRVVVGAAAVPQRNQVHRIVLAHRQQAVFVVFVQIVKQAQVAVGIGGVLGQVGFAEHHLRRFALNAAAVAAFQIDGFRRLIAFGRRNRLARRQLAAVDFVKAGQAYDAVFNQRAGERGILGVFGVDGAGSQKQRQKGGFFHQNKSGEKGCSGSLKAAGAMGSKNFQGGILTDFYVKTADAKRQPENFFRLPVRHRDQTEKEEPQPQVVTALGLLRITNCEPCRPSV